MIWENVTKFRQNFIAPKFFWAGTAMVSNNVFFVFILINLLWGSVNNGQPLHELHNNKSLRTPALTDSHSCVFLAPCDGTESC